MPERTLAIRHFSPCVCGTMVMFAGSFVCTAYTPGFVRLPTSTVVSYPACAGSGTKRISPGV
ncbi:MAG: hypothetical protein ABW276_11250 [Casimicrobiaceae bacterium]